MRDHLQPWYDRWLADHEKTNLLFVARDRHGGIYLPQVHFVRDQLAGLFWADVPYDARKAIEPRASCKETAYVIGEHTSKSVRLPIYSLERPDLGLQVVLRENYHDWNLSVISETPVTADLRGFELDDARCYFEGFPPEVRFGAFRENPKKFSLYIGSDYAIYTFLWLLMRDRRGTK